MSANGASKNEKPPRGRLLDRSGSGGLGFADHHGEDHMAKNEKTGGKPGSLASKAMRAPSTLTTAEIRRLGASALTQRPDKPKRAPSKKKKGR